jgi:hypothetical protein
MKGDAGRRTAKMAIKIGCCGFPVARQKYFEQFSTVEIQQTFYQLPTLSTARKWREEAPEGFEFTAKAWQLITHEPTSPAYRRLKKSISEDNRNNYGSFKPTDEVFEALGATEQFCGSPGETGMRRRSARYVRNWGSYIVWIPFEKLRFPRGSAISASTV